MRRLCAAIALLVMASACGGGAATTEQAPAKTPQSDSDPAFTDYAAVARHRDAQRRRRRRAGGDRRRASPRGDRQGQARQARRRPDRVAPVREGRRGGQGRRQVGDDDRPAVRRREALRRRRDQGRVVRGGARPRVARARRADARAAPTRPTTSSIYAGKPGESEGSVRYGGRGAVPGAKIVEAPEAGGYTLEAIVPWSALPGGAVHARRHPRRRALRRGGGRDRDRPGEPAAPVVDGVDPQRAGAVDDRAVSRAQGPHEGRADVRRRRRPHGRRRARAHRGVRALPHDLRELVPRGHRLLLPRPRRRAREARRARRHGPRKGGRGRAAPRQTSAAGRASTSRSSAR